MKGGNDVPGVGTSLYKGPAELPGGASVLKTKSKTMGGGGGIRLGGGSSALRAKETALVGVEKSPLASRWSEH